MLGWLLDSPEKKARKADLEDLRTIMGMVRSSARCAAEKAGEASQRVLIEDSELDKEIAQTYAESINALRHSHRSMSIVEAELEQKIRKLGVFSRWSSRSSVPSSHQIA